MTKRKGAPPADKRVRSLPNIKMIDYRAMVDARLADLATRAGSVHWVRHERYDSATYTATINGHRVSVWQTDMDDWRVTLETHNIELPIGRARSSADGRKLARTWAEAHDPSKVRLARKLHMGFWVQALDEDAFLPAPALDEAALAVA